MDEEGERRPGGDRHQEASQGHGSAFSFRGKALDIRDIGRQRSPGDCLVNLNSLATMALLRQYSVANFSAGMDARGATMITDPAASRSVSDTFDPAPMILVPTRSRRRWTHHST
jgi:hypothetical protein